MLRTSDQFIDDIRSDLADRPDIGEGGRERDTLWSDADLLRYLNSAAARLASDTLGLRKQFTIQVTAGTALLPFPYWQVLDFITAGFNSPAFGSSTYNLTQFDMNEGICRDDYGVMINVQPDYNTTGNPRYFTRDVDGTFMRLYPIPMVDGVFTALAYVLPTPIQAGMPVPFQAQQDWDLLLMWAKNMAYRKHDADTLDLDRADAFRAEYNSTVIDRRSEIDRIARDGGIIRPS